VRVLARELAVAALGAWRERRVRGHPRLPLAVRHARLRLVQQGADVERVLDRRAEVVVCELLLAVDLVGERVEVVRSDGARTST
jgi:hypothetical protein